MMFEITPKAVSDIVAISYKDQFLVLVRLHFFFTILTYVLSNMLPSNLSTDNTSQRLMHEVSETMSFLSCVFSFQFISCMY